MKRNVINKILTGALVASMALGISGCSKEGKFNAKNFQKVAVEKLEAEEYSIDDLDPDDIEDLAADLEADLEDGIFFTCTGEELLDSDFYDEDIMDIIMAIADIDLDYEDISSTSIYIREYTEDEDDYFALVSSLIEFNDKDSACGYFQSLIHNIDRYITIENAIFDLDFSLDSLDKDYYNYNDKNSGHLVIKINSSDIDVLDDADFGDFTIVIGFYINGNDVLTVLSACPDEEGQEEADMFFDALGMVNPYSLEATEVVSDMINDLIDNADDVAENWMEKLSDLRIANLNIPEDY